MRSRRLSCLMRALALIALACATASSIAGVTLRAVPACDQWTRTGQNRDGQEYLQERLWFLGFLSGMAFVTQKDFIKGSDNDSLTRWVDNYCKAHPQGGVDDAANELAGTLVKKKHL
jgi:hypothetical protein